MNWFVIGLIALAGFVVGTSMATASLLRLIDQMERYRADLEGVEIDGDWLFDVEPHVDLTTMSQAEAEARGLI